MPNETYNRSEGGYNIDYFLNLLKKIEKNILEKDVGVYKLEELNEKQVLEKLELLKDKMTKTELFRLEEYMKNSKKMKI